MSTNIKPAWPTMERMRVQLGLTRAQWLSVKDAARDASMSIDDYVRSMLLCACGHGGIIEHAERAVMGDWEASK